MGAREIAAPSASERLGQAWHLRRRGTGEVVEEFLGRPVAEGLMGPGCVVHALPPRTCGAHDLLPLSCCNESATPSGSHPLVCARTHTAMVGAGERRRS